jgi:PilZ domain
MREFVTFSQALATKFLNVRIAENVVFSNGLSMSAMDFNVDSKRLRLALEGRYMIVGSTEEYACTTYEISPSDAALFAPVAAPPGTKVVLYLKELGRFTGPILRTTELGFEMRLELTPQRSDKLAVQLAWRNDLASMKTEERRGRDRIVPLHDMTILSLSRGRECIARIVNISLGGAEIETDQPIAVGTEIVVGTTRARVLRLVKNGVVCRFLREFEPGEIDETTRL